jgi:patatin-like phospholipase/acyl hydrolase
LKIALSYAIKLESFMSFKILSLDGGGARGYLSAKILANIENYLNKKGNYSPHKNHS